MEQNNEEPGAKYSVVAMETTEKLQRICSNVVGYCRTVMNSAGKVFNNLDGKDYLLLILKAYVTWKKPHAHSLVLLFKGTVSQEIFYIFV